MLKIYYQNPSFSFSDPSNPIDSVNFQQVAVGIQFWNHAQYKVEQIDFSAYQVITDATWTGYEQLESFVYMSGIYNESPN